MGRVQERIASVLAAEIASRTEWDEPPALFWLALEGGVPCLKPAPLMPGAWSLGPPGQILSMIADACGDFSGMLQATAPEGLHGAAFYSEIWTVGFKPGSPEIEAAKADAAAHRLSRRPDRVEARSLWAVDRAGTVYAALFRRGIDSEPVTKRIVSAALAVSLR